MPTLADALAAHLANRPDRPTPEIPIELYRERAKVYEAWLTRRDLIEVDIVLGREAYHDDPPEEDDDEVPVAIPIKHRHLRKDLPCVDCGAPRLYKKHRCHVCDEKEVRRQMDLKNARHRQSRRRIA